MEVAVGKIRARVTLVAAGAADEELEAAPRRDRVGRGYLLAACEAVAVVVERGSAGIQRFKKRRQRLADIHQRAFAIAGWRTAKDAPIALRQCLVAHEKPGNAGGTAVEFAGVQDRSQTRQPQAVARSNPVVPALLAQIRERDRVAFQIGQAVCARPQVGKCAIRRVTTDAGDVSDWGHARIEEQQPSKCNRERTP
jgi:hypothetical protein